MVEVDGRRMQPRPESSGSAPAIIARRLRFQARECAILGSGLYAGLLGRAAADVEAGGPAWELLRGHEDDPGPSALALRLMGSVHRRVLAGRLPELARHYGEAAANPEHAWPAFRAALESDAAALRPLLERPVQTNEVGRCGALLVGFLGIAARTGLPLRLLELGASGGLNLRWDRYRYQAGEFAWGPPDSPLTVAFELVGEPPPSLPIDIAERRGCDPAPLDATSEEGRLTLRSYLWADQPQRADRLRAALAVAAATPVQIDRAGAAAWAAARLAEPVPGIAAVVFHSIVMQYLEESERQRLAATIWAAGERASAGAPLAWLRMEPAGEMADLRLTTWPGGEETHLARVGYHGNPVELVGG